MKAPQNDMTLNSGHSVKQESDVEWVWRITKDQGASIKKALGKTWGLSWTDNDGTHHRLAPADRIRFGSDNHLHVLDGKTWRRWVPQEDSKATVVDPSDGERYWFRNGTWVATIPRNQYIQARNHAWNRHRIGW